MTCISARWSNWAWYCSLLTIDFNGLARLLIIADHQKGSGRDHDSPLTLAQDVNNVMLTVTGVCAHSDSLDVVSRFWAIWSITAASRWT